MVEVLVNRYYIYIFLSKVERTPRIVMCGLESTFSIALIANRDSFYNRKDESVFEKPVTGVE